VVRVGRVWWWWCQCCCGDGSAFVVAVVVVVVVEGVRTGSVTIFGRTRT
jgi:hypothetical protein